MECIFHWGEKVVDNPVGSILQNMHQQSAVRGILICCSVGIARREMEHVLILLPLTCFIGFLYVKSLKRAIRCVWMSPFLLPTGKAASALAPWHSEGVLNLSLVKTDCDHSQCWSPLRVVFLQGHRCSTFSPSMSSELSFVLGPISCLFFHVGSVLLIPIPSLIFLSPHPHFSPLERLFNLR